jgi:hypothetical protein
MLLGCSQSTIYALGNVPKKTATTAVITSSPEFVLITKYIKDGTIEIVHFM